VLVLLTKADKCDPRIKLSQPESIHLIYESGAVFKTRKALADELRVEFNKILPVVSYDGTLISVYLLFVV
jgi:hypothetical protein